MGKDLNRAGGSQRFSNTSWGKILELAYDYGWRPQGTEAAQWYDENGELNKQLSPAPDEWDSNNYFTNDFQFVTEADAANIADALQQALDDIPDFDTDEKWVEYGPGELPTSPVERSLVEDGFVINVPNASLSLVEYFSGEDKQLVRGFIRFCQAGAFCIG
jgi:hypothetical protein